MLDKRAGGFEKYYKHIVVLTEHQNHTIVSYANNLKLRANELNSNLISLTDFENTVPEFIEIDSVEFQLEADSLIYLRNQMVKIFSEIQ